MAAKKKAKKKIVKKKAKKKSGKKKATKKKAAKKKTNKRIGGKKSKAVTRTEEQKNKSMLGNSFWKARSSHGRNPIFKNPDQLWDACIQYFEWVEDNPLSDKKLFSFQGFVHSGRIDKIRAMTIEGLCIFLGISDNTWLNYRKKDDFLRIVSDVEKVIRTQKFEGAAADLLNSNIIARDLGLKDKQDHSSEDGSMATPKALTKKQQEILDKALDNEY